VKETTQPVIRERPPEEETPDAFRAMTGAGGTTALFQQFSQQLQEISKQRQQLMEQQQKWYEKLVKREPKPMEEVLEEQFGKWAIPETFQQLQQITQLTLPLQQQLADLQTQETAEIERIEKQAIPQPVIDQQITATRNKYAKLRAPIATQLQAYAAQMEALQGNLTTARQFAQMAVNAATYDEEQQYNRLRDLIQMNQTFIDSLTSDQRFILTQALAEARNQLQLTRQDKLFVMNLMIDPDTAPAFQGIDINTLTAEDAAQIAQEYLAERPAEVGELTDADRINQITSFINSRRGRDGLISAETYIEAQRQWIGLGGTVTDFKAAFPPESLMRPQELQRLPASVYKPPTTGISMFLPTIPGGFGEQEATSIANKIVCEWSGGVWNSETNTCER